MLISVVPVAIKSTEQKIINPEIYSQIANLELISRKILDGFLSGLHQSSFHGYNIEFAEHKQYVPGDNPSYIDWKLFARSGKLFSKKYLEERNMRTFFFLDNSASMGFGNPSKWNYSIITASTLSLLLLSKKDTVGLWLFNKEISSFLHPSGKRSYIRNICRFLEKAYPDGKTELGGSLFQLASNLKKRSLIILISDLFSDQESLFNAIRILSHKGHEIIVMHLLSNEELEFNYEGTKRIIDMETQEDILIDASYWRDYYKKTLSSNLNKFNEFFSKSSVDYMLVSTKVPIEKTLFNLLYRRKRGKVHVVLS